MAEKIPMLYDDDTWPPSELYDARAQAASENPGAPAAVASDSFAATVAKLRDADWSWAGLAACRDADPNIFFAPFKERKDDKLAREDVAKACCAKCDVRDECLEYAITQKETAGVWGGTNEQERRQILERRRSQAAAARRQRLPNDLK